MRLLPPQLRACPRGRTYFFALAKPVIADRAEARFAVEVDRVRRMRTGDA